MKKIIFVESTPASEPFDVMMQVLTHKRCVNCHPSVDRPRQGEDCYIHNFNIQRGEDGHGMVSVQCSTCHHDENNDYSGVPGAPHWHLAPKSMAWEGLNRILEHGDKRSGVGEPPISATGAAIANAVFAATGKRLRNMPLNKDVKA